MKMQIRESAGGEFAKKGEDVKPGDKVSFVNEGKWVQGGQYGDQFVIGVKTRNGDKNVNLNQTNINALIKDFGDDSKAWIGKELVVRSRKTVIAGKKVEVYSYVPEAWNFDDYGELVKEGAESVEEEEIDPEDIPF